jgi:hypothetical protein
MLLHLMALAEAGTAAGSLAVAAGYADVAAGYADVETGDRPNSSNLRVFGDRDSIDTAAAAADVCGGNGDDPSCNAAAVAAALQHYQLIRCDLYQDQFLRNSVVRDAQLRAGGEFAGDAVRPGMRGTLGSSMAPDGACSKAVLQQQQMVVTASVAELLVWLSRSGQTTAVLQRVLEVAKAEQQLAQQVWLPV